MSGRIFVHELARSGLVTSCARTELKVNRVTSRAFTLASQLSFFALTLSEKEYLFVRFVLIFWFHANAFVQVVTVSKMQYC